MFIVLGAGNTFAYHNGGSEKYCINLNPKSVKDYMWIYLKVISDLIIISGFIIVVIIRLLLS